MRRILFRVVWIHRKNKIKPSRFFLMVLLFSDISIVEGLKKRRAIKSLYKTIILNISSLIKTKAEEIINE